MSDKEYFSHPFINASKLKIFSGREDRYSKRQALHQLQTPKKSKAFDFGTLFHQGMELGHIDAKAAPFTEFRTNEAKAWRDSQVEKGLPIIKQQDIDKAKTMIESVKISAPDVWDKARDSLGIREREVYNSELLTKCKEDLFLDGTIWDWKTCADPTPYGIKLACDKFGYDLQAYHYMQTDTDADQFKFLFVQTEPPHEVVIVPARSILERGKMKWETAMRRYMERLDSVLDAEIVDPSWDEPHYIEEEETEAIEL